MNADSSATSLPPQETNPGSYRDELNFAEFPIASLGERVPAGVKTLVFTDTIFDQGRRAPVTRTLTISASDQFGLPTALDDEVILGLIQLTNRGRFGERKVHFTLYELVKLLGWRDEGRSYERLAQSLKRWLGVTLYYERAWWAKEDKAWVSENFHILDQVTLFDRERRERKRKSHPDDPKAAKSSFVWNEKVFESFQAGNLKRLDFDFYKGLDSAISKRLFRFLDKRFYHRDRLEFDLREFACEKVAFARSHPNSEIKRLLAGPIRELEGKGFLKPLSADERYQEASRGVWRIVFVAEPAFRDRKRPTNEQEIELVDRGVSAGAAARIAEAYEPAKIDEKLRHFDKLREGGDPKVSKNPAGFLVRSIEKDFKVNAAEEAKPIPTPVLNPPARSKPVKPDRGEVLSCLWDSLSDEERTELEEAGLKAANQYLRKQYDEKRAGGGSLFKAVQKAIVYQELERRLSR